jgi:hypothetical protein
MTTPVESFSPFDAADYLTSVDDIVAYLEAWSKTPTTTRP